MGKDRNWDVNKPVVEVLAHQSKLQQELYKTVIGSLEVLNDSSHNYGLTQIDMEDRARALSQLLPVLFKVELHPDDPANTNQIDSVKEGQN